MFRNYYVHRDLLKAWSDDGVVVSFYNPVTKEEAAKREIDSLYYFDYPDFLPQSVKLVEANENFLSITLKALKDGSLNITREPTEAGRRSLLFQYTRLPIFNKFDYIKYGDGNESLRTLKALKGRDYFTESEYIVKLSQDFLVRVAEFAGTDSFALMDLKAKFLVPSDGKSFIIGPSASNVLNPYFEKRFMKCEYVDKSYDIIGAVMILPFEPERALMLYDSSVYDLSQEGDTIALSPSDTDILNMVQIYNSDIDGVVYKGESTYLDKLTSKIGAPYTRDGYDWNRSDRFPFPTLLSFMSVNDEGKKNLKKNLKSPLRPLVRKVREHFNGTTFDPDNREDAMHLYLYAKSIIDD